MPMDYNKQSANEVIAVWVAPTGAATGITEIGEPLAAELNNTGGTSAMLNVSQAISFNDFSFGMEASETLNEPSLSDSNQYVEFGQYNFGGAMSPYYPKAYDDASNTISNLYDIIDTPGSRQDVATRIDGDIDDQAPAADGDFVSTFRVQREGETNPFTPGESKRYVASFIPRSEFADWVTVGDQAVTAIGSGAVASGDTGRFRASQNGRDTTNRLEWTTDDPAVVEVWPGGFYRVNGAGSATVTATDPKTGDNDTIAVTAS